MDHFFVDHSRDPFQFSFLTVLVIAIALAIGTLIWCWTITNLTLRISRQEISESRLASLALGALFSIIGYALNYFLDKVNASFLLGLTSFSLWALCFPAAAALAVVHKMPPSRTSPGQSS